MRQIADGGTRLGEAIPGVRLDQPGGNAAVRWIFRSRCARPGRSDRAATARSAPESSGVTRKVRLISCIRNNGAGMAKQEL